MLYSNFLPTPSFVSGRLAFRLGDLLSFFRGSTFAVLVVHLRLSAISFALRKSRLRNVADRGPFKPTIIFWMPSRPYSAAGRLTVVRVGTEMRADVAMVIVALALERLHYPLLWTAVPQTMEPRMV